MNAMHFLSSQAWVARLGWTLIHFLWQGLLIAALYALVRRGMRFRGPNARYVLACGALFTMMASPLLTLTMLHQPEQPSVRQAQPMLIPSSGSVVASAAPIAAASTVNWPTQYLPVIVFISIVGAMLFWVRLIGGWMAAASMRSVQVRPATEEWQKRIGELALRIRVSAPVRLLVSAKVQVPAVIGWIRPVILIPLGALAGLPAEQIEGLLLHELAHISRHDYLVNIVQGIAEALLFYHPAVWWVSGHIRAEREHCCDDIAVSATGDALNYASALAELESSRQLSARAVMAVNRGSLKARIARLLGESRRESEAPSAPGMVASATLTSATVAALFLIAFSVLDGGAQTAAALQARSKVDQGIRAFDEKKYELAVGYLQDALQLDPALNTAELYLARAYAGQYYAAPHNQDKQFGNKAIEAYEKLLQKDPGNVTALAGAAGIYQNTGQLQKAHDDYLQIEQLMPLNPVPFYSVGAVDWIMAYDRKAPPSPEEKGRILEEGLHQIDIALALNPEYEDAMTYKNLLLREKATLAPDKARQRSLVAEADVWFDKALAARRKREAGGQPSGLSGPVDMAPPPPPPPPPPPVPNDSPGQR